MLQAEVIEALLQHGVDALCVNPYFPQALEMVLAKARRRGTIVIVYEGSNVRNKHYAVEAFNNTAFGERMMDSLARYMNEEGEYVVFVGSSTTKSHMEWADAAISMDGRGRCYDHIFIERLWRSVKYDKVYLCDWQHVHEAQAGCDEYLTFDNHERPHQSLQQKTPFEVYCHGL